MKTCLMYYLMLSSCFLGFVGCSTTSLTTDRTVSEDNTFVSTAQPALNLKIFPDFKYLGEIKHQEQLQQYSSTMKREAYFFGEIEGNIYQRGVTVSIATLPNGIRWHGQVFPFDRSQTLETGSVKINNITHQYVVVAPVNAFTTFEREFLTEKSYQPSSCYLLKVFARGNTNVRVYISYFEELSSCRAWHQDALTDAQQKLLEEFNGRSAKNLIIQ